MGKSLTNFESKALDLSAIPYVDANKGNQKAELQEKRKIKLEEKLKKREEDRAAYQDARAKEKEEKRKRYEKTRQKKRVKKREQGMDEWNDLQREENLFKKFRKGKISKEEYDKIILGEDIDSD